MHLPPNMNAKTSSSNFQKFAERYGTHAYELEAVPPTTLQGFLRQHIVSVMDMDAFKAEIEHEKKDAAFLEWFTPYAFMAPHVRLVNDDGVVTGLH